MMETECNDLNSNIAILISESPKTPAPKDEAEQGSMTPQSLSRRNSKSRVVLEFVVKHAVPPGYRMCVVGECVELGVWVPRLAKVMDLAFDAKDNDTWTVEVKLRRTEIQYRYFICAPLHKTSCSHDEQIYWDFARAAGLSILQWESSPVPRSVDLRKCPVDLSGSLILSSAFFGQMDPVQQLCTKEQYAEQLKVQSSAICSTLSFRSVSQVTIDQPLAVAGKWLRGWLTENVTQIRMSLCSLDPIRLLGEYAFPENTSVCVKCRMIDYSKIMKDATTKHKKESNISQSIRHWFANSQNYQCELFQRFVATSSVPMASFMSTYMNPSHKNKGSMTSPPFATNILAWKLDSDQFSPHIHEHDKNGVVYNVGDFLNFSCDTVCPEDLGFRIDFYRMASATNLPLETPSPKIHIGYCHVPPLCLSGHHTKLPIFSNLQNIIGDVTIRYLAVQPHTSLRHDMEPAMWRACTECKELDKRRIDVPLTTNHWITGRYNTIPHLMTYVKANTLDAVKQAGNNSDGYRWMQLPIHFTCDMKPVLCAEPTIYVKKRHSSSYPGHNTKEMFQVDIKDWTLKELQKLTAPYGDQDDTSFPTLQQCSACLSSDVGLYIVVYVETNDEGSSQSQKFKLIDEFLTRLWQDVWPRRTIISSFDHDTCIMLQKKQNLFPVVLSCSHSIATNCQGQDTAQSAHADPRALSHNMAIHSAASEHMLGVALPAASFLSSLNCSTIGRKGKLKKESMTKAAHKLGLIVVAWSECKLPGDVINTLLQEHHVDLITLDNVGFPYKHKNELHVYTLPLGTTYVDTSRVRVIHDFCIPMSSAGMYPCVTSTHPNGVGQFSIKT